MVFEERPSWLQVVIHLRSSVLTRIWGRLLLTTMFALAVTEAFEFKWIPEKLSLSVTPFTLIGLALGIFLGFRNNTSYQRFWEGRILWGRLVNTSRSLTRQIMTLVQIPPGSSESEEALADYQRSFVHHVAAYVHALRFHLRDEKAKYAELERLIPEDDLDALQTSSNPPIQLVQGLGQRATEAWKRGWLETFHLPTVEASLTNLTDIQGGCERIKSTPIPFSYTILIHRIVAVYCLALPFGLVTTTHQATPLVVLLVSYAFFGLDAIGDEIENPFGTDVHDLPLEAMSTMIEVNVREQLGETELPALKTPDHNVLS